MDEYPGNERREFLRYDYDKSLHYSVVSASKDRKPIFEFIKAISKNLSASGILFTTKDVPQISSLLLLNLDYKTVNLCREIEDRVLIVNNKLLGKVVRIEDNKDDLCDVGVAFVTKSEGLSEDIKRFVA